jgi:hypothetical protein
MGEVAHHPHGEMVCAVLSSDCEVVRNIDLVLVHARGGFRAKTNESNL